MKYQVDQSPDLPFGVSAGAPADDVVPDEKATDLGELADRLLLPLSWLEEVDWLIKDRRAVIFTGPPGSGKTFLARALADYYSPRRTEFIQFHPSYSYEDFVEGYRPVPTDVGGVSFELTPGPLRLMVDRSSASASVHTLVIDEINRANISKVFGELFFALEYRDVSVRTQYGNEVLSVPSNLNVLGTMNTADRSISSFDSALRRRFHFVDCSPVSPPFDGLLGRYMARHQMSSMAWLPDVIRQVNERLEDPAYAIGPSHFMKPTLTAGDASKIWAHSVFPFLESRFDRQILVDMNWASIAPVETAPLVDGSSDAVDGESETAPGA